MGGTGHPLGKTFFLHCQRRHPELPRIPTYLPQENAWNVRDVLCLIRCYFNQFSLGISFKAKLNSTIDISFPLFRTQRTFSLRPLQDVLEEGVVPSHGTVVNMNSSLADEILGIKKLIGHRRERDNTCHHVEKRLMQRTIPLQRCIHETINGLRTLPRGPISAGGFTNSAMSSSRPCTNAVELSLATRDQSLHAATARSTRPYDLEQVREDVPMSCTLRCLKQRTTSRAFAFTAPSSSTLSTRTHLQARLRCSLSSTTS